MGLIRSLRRSSVLKHRRVDPDLWAAALRAQPMARRLRREETDRLREMASILLAEKDFHGPEGFEIDSRMRVAVALQACIPILNLGIDSYNGWHSFILTPKVYTETRQEFDEGVVHEWEEEISGEVLHFGSVVLVWSEVRRSAGDYQVVVHEMAHKLDGLTGEVDGVPPLAASARKTWIEDFSAAFADFLGDSPTASPEPGSVPQSARSGRRSRLRPALDEYAATDPGEFFAVASEAFFGNPAGLRHRLPRIYDHLAGYYRQDPLGST